MNQQLIDYIKNQLKLGRSEDVIKAMLKNNGWQEADIEEGFREISGGANPSAPPLPQSAPSGQELALPGAGALLKNSWHIYKSRFWTLIGIVIILALVWLVILVIGSLFWMLSSFLPTYSGLNISFIVLAFVLMIPGIILSVWAGAALFYAVVNETFSLKEAFRQAWVKRITSFVWVGLLMGSIAMGGFILGIVPIIIFAIWFIVAQFVFVVEEKKGFNALLRSKEYVAGRWGKVFWQMFAFGLVAIAVSLVSWGISFGIGIIYKPASVISLLINILLGPFTMVYLFSLYSALRQTRPQLANQPVVAKKGFFVFCAILGVLAPVIILIMFFPLPILLLFLAK